MAGFKHSLCEGLDTGPKKGLHSFPFLLVSSSQLQNSSVTSLNQSSFLWKECRAFKMVIKKGHPNPSQEITHHWLYLGTLVLQNSQTVLNP